MYRKYIRNNCVGNIGNIGNIVNIERILTLRSSLRGRGKVGLESSLRETSGLTYNMYIYIYIYVVFMYILVFSSFTPRTTASASYADGTAQAACLINGCALCRSRG